VNALPYIIKKLTEEGYKFERIDKLDSYADGN
jgi:peptidoglycan/xylan/chitin deacetylase (PgdA/CDA1 family)